MLVQFTKEEKRKRFDSVLWQKSLYQQKMKKKTSEHKNTAKTIIQQLRNDLGLSVGETTATKLVWLSRFTSAQPSHYPHKLCNFNDIKP